MRELVIMIKKITLGRRTVEYELIRKKVKNINLRIKTDGTIHVSANKYVPVRAIEDFIIQKGEAILKSIDRFSDRKAEANIIYILGKKIVIFKEVAESGKTGILFNGENIRLKLLDVDDEESSKYFLRKLIEHISEEVLMRMFNDGYEKCKNLTKLKPVLKMGFRKTVWGTCHPQKNQIILNRKLVMLPKECIEAIIIHEFCHFGSIRHDKKFYDVMSKYLPDWKEKNKLLREYESKVSNYKDL